jgi:nucleoside-diphosphate-sugar epimerase
MKKILILGVNGFIGHHLSKRIIDATDWDIYGMDMQTDRISDLLPEKRFHFSKATSPSIASGSNTTSRSATRCCRW